MVAFSNVGDQSSSDTTDQAKVDARITQIIDMEDSSVVEDLRALNTGQAAHFGRNVTDFLMKILLLTIGAMVLLHI